MKFKISVPATSANIGPGFDVMGVAFDMFNRFTFETDVGESVITGCEPEFSDKENNLVYTTLEKTLKSYNVQVPPVKIHIDADVPICSGLGSSSTCVVAGIMAANKIAGLNFGKGKILHIASHVEGHPDNVAPAIFGGLVAAVIEDDFVYWHNYPISDSISFYALTPDIRVSTEKARAILPTSYKMSDCIYNLSRVPILLEGLEKGDVRLIRAGCKDRIHQTYRLQLVPEGDKVFNFIKDSDNAVTAYVSGAGPTIIAVVVNDDDGFGNEVADFCDALSLHWRIRKMHVNRLGANLKTIIP